MVFKSHTVVCIDEVKHCCTSREEQLLFSKPSYKIVAATCSQVMIKQQPQSDGHTAHCNCMQEPMPPQRVGLEQGSLGRNVMYM